MSDADWLTFLIVALILGVLFWLLFSKMGYRGKARWWLVLSSLFPFFFVINLFVVCLITWPIQQELKALKKQIAGELPPGKR